MALPHLSACTVVRGFLCLILLGAAPYAYADSSTMYGGALGLNTVPSARVDQAGTWRASVARASPYTHVAAGFQLTPSLYVGLRQTYESSDFGADATHLYPGIDGKLLLFHERKFRPAIAVGVQSAFGHKRMAAEYLALSKRFHNLDITVGGGFGRMGTRQVFGNPLLLNQLTSSSKRELDGEDPQRLSDFFKGRMGLFAGASYDLPLDGLSAKFDWSSDNWDAEKNADAAFDAPAPWSLGLAYAPLSWLDVGVAWAGGDHLISRVSVSGDIGSWPFSESAPLTAATAPTLFRTKKSDHLSVVLDLPIRDGYSAPEMIGFAARGLDAKSKKSVQQFAFQLRRYGLKGPELALNRRDIHLNVSPEEIWDHTDIVDTPPVRGLFREAHGLRFDFATDVSLSEEDNGIMYRTSFIPAYFKHFNRYFLSEQALRINLAHNLENLNSYRGLSVLPVRSNIDVFAARRLVMERNVLSAMGTPFEDVHVAASAGYFEEMYGGFGGEILYRPYGKPWALAVDASIAMKRDPNAALALGFNGDHILTGHVTGYYEIPGTESTASLALGRYLAGDVGGTFGLETRLENGARFGGKMTMTNVSDIDAYGDTTNMYAGLEMRLPLGSLSFMPHGSSFGIKTYPLGRETGQMLDRPHRLYDISAPLSYRTLTQRWTQLRRGSP